MEGGRSKKVKLTCESIIQRGVRIGQRCGNPAGMDRICHNCRRKLKLSRVDAKYKGQYEDGDIFHIHRKGITSLKEGLMVRNIQDQKRIKYNKEPISSRILEEDKVDKPLDSSSNGLKILGAKSTTAMSIINRVIECEKVMDIYLPKMVELLNNQKILQENQQKLITMFQQATSQNSIGKDSNSGTTNTSLIK